MSAPKFDAGADAHAETYQRGWEAGNAAARAESEGLRAALTGLMTTTSFLLSVIESGERLNDDDWESVKQKRNAARAALAPSPAEPAAPERCGWAVSTTGICGAPSANAWHDKPWGDGMGHPFQPAASEREP